MDYLQKKLETFFKVRVPWDIKEYTLFSLPELSCSICCSSDLFNLDISCLTAIINCITLFSDF